MRFVLQGVASEDTVQLFDTLGNPVVGVPLAQIEVWIKKETDTNFNLKVVAVGEWTDRGNGNYALDFSGSDFDTLGLFRYQVLSTVSAFIPYADALEVVDAVPLFPPDPPVINEQSDVPPGVIPDPVYRGTTLTINGANLSGALTVTIGGIPCPITSNTDTQIEVTVLDPDVALGEQTVVVKTAGGEASTTVRVALDPADIPGSGMCNIYFYTHLSEPQTVGLPGGYPVSGIGAWGQVLDLPNIQDGVGWVDKKQIKESNTEGRVDFWFPRNVRCEVGCPRLKYRRVFTVPDLSEANLFTQVPNP